MLCLLHASTLVLIATAPTSAQDSFAGAWATDFGALTLTQSGTDVTGTYDYKGPATLTGTLRGKLLTFTYKEASGATGKGEFTLAPDGKSFRGRWVSGSQLGPWNGKKQGDNEAREKAKADNAGKWPQLRQEIQPYRETLESFARELDEKWWVQSQVVPNRAEDMRKALADLAAVEVLMAGKYAGMTPLGTPVPNAVMEHPEAWLEVAKARVPLAQSFAKKATVQHLISEIKALQQVAQTVENSDGFGLKQLGLDLVMGKREAVKARALAPLTPLLEVVGLTLSDDSLTEWNAAADALVATARRKATTTKPAGPHHNAMFEAQVREAWAKGWPERKIVRVGFSRADWHVTTNGLGTPLYRSYGGMVQYKIAGFDYVIEAGVSRREDYQGNGKYTYRPMPYEPELRIVKI